MLHGQDLLSWFQRQTGELLGDSFRLRFRILISIALCVWNFPHVLPSRRVGRALTNQDLVTVPDDDADLADRGHSGFLPDGWDERLQVVAIGDALAGEWASMTLRCGRRADERSEFHDGLVEIAGALGGHRCFRHRPDPRLPLAFAGVAAVAEEAGQDAEAVGFDDWKSAVERLRQDRTDDVPADSG